MRRLGRAVWTRRYDLAALAGGVAIACAVGTVFLPAGVIVGGGLCILWGILGARVEAAERRRASL
jgi:hypothetical protein